MCYDTGNQSINPLAPLSSPLAVSLVSAIGTSVKQVKSRRCAAAASDRLRRCGGVVRARALLCSAWFSAIILSPTITNMTSPVAIKAPRIAFLSGSTRSGSFNSSLIIAAERIASNLGASTNIIDLLSYNLPLCNQDLEASKGMPPAAVELKSVLADQDAWVVSTPEYNGFPPLLVNTFTWLSRGDPQGQMYATFANKSAIVLSASPGAMGGMRAINPTRTLLTNLGVNVLAPSAAVGGAFKAFDEEGNLTDERQKQRVEAAMTSLFHIARDAANREAAPVLVNMERSVFQTRIPKQNKWRTETKR